MNSSDEILRGVETVKCDDRMIPGRLLVFRSNAEPVLTSSERPEDLIIAAAELGQGRIVVFAHDGFAARLMRSDADDDGNALLYGNVKNWVSRGALSSSSAVDGVLYNDENSSLNIQTLDGLVHYKIVVFHAVHPKVVEDSVLEEFVRKGGGLIYAITPWGWMQLNEDRTLDQAPYFSLLHEAGVALSPDMSSCDGAIETKLSHARESHILKCIQCTDLRSTARLAKVNSSSSRCGLPNDIVEAIEARIKDNWRRCDADVHERFRDRPIGSCDADGKCLLDVWQTAFDAYGSRGVKAPGICHFPGDFDVLPATSCGQFEYSSEREDFYHTNCYAPAGRSVTIRVTSLSPSSAKWKAIVGCHQDVLNDVAVRRWPKISYSYDLVDGTTLDICSPYGGLITLVSPAVGVASIGVRISDFVATPYFDLRDVGSVRDWKRNRMLPGLWSNISGKWVTVTLPSSTIRDLEDPAPALHFFDQLREAYHDLRGTDNSTHRREWIVADEQPSAGYMHAGYPIVTHLDVAQPTNRDFLLNGTNLRQIGNWGIFHEIGHNMQQDAWTFDGTGEVTVNIFTLYVMETLCGKKAWVHDWLKPHVAAAAGYFRAGADFEKWKADPGLGLIIYAQLINTFGWDAYKKVMRRYQNLSPDDRPVTDQDKIDLWFYIFSQECGCNLHPLASLWGIPLSEKGCAKLGALGLSPTIFWDEIYDLAKYDVDIMQRFPDLEFMYLK